MVWHVEHNLIFIEHFRLKKYTILRLQGKFSNNLHPNLTKTNRNDLPPLAFLVLLPESTEGGEILVTALRLAVEDMR